MLKPFPKIFAIGATYIRDILNGPVEISEKVDGSQFCFGKINGQVFKRSKGAELFSANPEKMFREGIEYVDSIAEELPDGIAFYGEYLKSPKHNTLAYDRVPRNHIMLFGAMDIRSDSFSPDFEYWADRLDLEVVPKIVTSINRPEDLTDMLNRVSVLGGAKIEGVVVKNYALPFLLGGQPMPIMAGKFVSEAFKEVHRGRWNAEEKGGSKLATFCGSFCTPARWAKAVQHLAEAGTLEHSPKDIGALMREVSVDIEAEEKDAIKEWLWNHHKREILGAATHGLPGWYKQQLLESSFVQ